MREVYPVYFTRTDTVVLVEVPDLEILTEGKDMNDAIDMARDAIEVLCVTKEDAGEEIPIPSQWGDLDIRKGTFSEEGRQWSRWWTSIRANTEGKSIQGQLGGMWPCQAG